MVKDFRVTEHFMASELFPPEILDGKLSEFVVLGLLDNRIYRLLEELRRHFGKPIILNSWKQGGRNSYRGFRPENCKVGSRYSQHKFGRAIDINVKGMTSSEVFDNIVANTDRFLSCDVSTLEDKKLTPTWTHIDLRYIRRLDDDLEYILRSPQFTIVGL